MLRKIGKKILRNINPAYRVALRLEEENVLLFHNIDCLKRELIQMQSLIKSYGMQNQMFFWWQIAEPGESFDDVQKRFHHSIPQAGHDLRMVQLGNVFLLSKLQEICNNHDIHIWLDFGNLLGAVRHKGFIPWDDDLDVGILRKDLKKLREVINDYPDFELADGYYISKTVGRFTRFIAKGYEIPSFVDLDVFDFCNFPDDDETWKLICNLRRKFMLELNELKPILKENYDIPNAVITPQNEEDIKRITEICDRYAGILGTEDEAKTIYWAIDSTRPVYRALIDKDIVFPLGKMEFEKGIYEIPGRYDDYLKIQYSDYYMLPTNVGVPKHKEFAHYYDYIDQIEEYLKNNGEIIRRDHI